MDKPRTINLEPIKYRELKHFYIFRKPVITTISNTSTLIIDDYELVCEDKNESLEVGREVILTGSLYKRVFLEYKDEVDRYNEFQKNEKIRLEKERIDSRKANSELFWKSYNIPFKYSLEIKERLSGLSFNSCGNGTAKNSTFHLYVHEDYKNGKLIRPKNSFLCSEQKIYANWSGSLGENTFSNDIYGIPNVVTCKQCLKIMKRFKNG